MSKLSKCISWVRCLWHRQEPVEAPWGRLLEVLALPGGTLPEAVCEAVRVVCDGAACAEHYQRMAAEAHTARVAADGRFLQERQARVRERLLEAVRCGRLSPSALPEWQERLNQDYEGGLEALAAAAPIAPLHVVAVTQGLRGQTQGFRPCLPVGALSPSLSGGRLQSRTMRGSEAGA